MQILKIPEGELQLLGEQESPSIATMDTYIDSTLAHISHGGLEGDKLPWDFTHNDVRLGPGEVSIWAGINGHGKSTLLTQVTTYLILNKRKCFIASMEMKPEQILRWMTSQAASCVPSEQFVRQFLHEYRDYGYIYGLDSHVGSIPCDRMLGVVNYCGKLGIDHVFIDSLTLCGVGRDDYEGQGGFVKSLRFLAEKHNLHVHLVAHMRKGENEGKSVGKFDIRGAGEISDIADKVFIVQRNKRREQELRLRKMEKPDLDGNYPPNKYIDEQAGTWLKCEKNRQDGIEESYGLFFDRRSFQFTRKENAPFLMGPS